MTVLDVLAAFSPENPAYLISLPLPGTNASPKSLRSGDRSIIKRWIEAEDRPGFGVYYCPNGLKRNAARHGRDSTEQIRTLYVDVDLKDIVEEPEAVEQKFKELYLSPTWIVNSGHGYHLGWELKEPIASSSPEFEQACRLQETLLEHLGGDRQVRPWSLLRVPDTTNYKATTPVPCKIIYEGAPVDVSELLDLVDIIGASTLLTRKPPTVEAKETVERTPGAKVDAEAELVAMVPGQVNATHVRVIPSLLQKDHPDDVLNTVVDATMSMAERCGLKWSRDDEVRAIRSKILSAYNNLLLKDYDPSTGVIPTWLPGEFHEAWINRLQLGATPVISYNRNGFHIRQAHVLDKASAGSTVLPFDKDAPPTAPASPPARRFVLTPFKPFDLAALPLRQWLYGKHYQRRTVSATIAPGGFGKTTLGMVEAVAMATTRNLLGEQPDARLRVWFHNGEDNLEELYRRLGAICLHYAIPQEELQGWLFLTSGNEVPLRVANGYSDIKLDKVLIKCIEDEIAANEIDVALLDPLITLHGVSEQDNGAMDRVIRIFAGIADAQDCAVGLAHHTRKQAPGVSSDYTMDDMRGASATRDAVRAARMLNQMGVKDAEAVGIQEHERTSYFRVDRVKGNNAPAGQGGMAALYQHRAAQRGRCRCCGAVAVPGTGRAVSRRWLRRTHWLMGCL